MLISFKALGRNPIVVEVAQGCSCGQLRERVRAHPACHAEATHKTQLHDRIALPDGRVCVGCRRVRRLGCRQARRSWCGGRKPWRTTQLWLSWTTEVRHPGVRV